MLKEVGGDGANEVRPCWTQGGSCWTFFGGCGGKPLESLKQGSDRVCQVTPWTISVSAATI